MCSTLKRGVRLAFLSLMLCLAGSAGTIAHAQPLTATLTTDRGCGASAVYNIGERDTFLFSTSEAAQVTLTLTRPDGTISVLLANQPILGGVTYALNGVIGNPPGQRTLALDAVAGSQTAHVECTYSAQSTTSTLTATLQTNKACGPTALFNVGEPNSFLFSTSQNALVTLTLVRPDGTSSVFLSNFSAQGGVTYRINGVIGNPTGQRQLFLHAVAGAQTVDMECDYTAQGTVTPLTLTLTTDHGCGAGAVYNLGDPTVFSYSASQNATVTLTLIRPDGTSSILANRVVQGGVVYQINGVVGNPLGQRRLLLHAVAGSQTADMECDYTAQGTVTPLTVTLTTDHGCGAGAVYNLGDPTVFSYSASQNATVTLTLVRPDGTSAILANRVVQGGVVYQINGVVGNPLGQRQLFLHAVAGSQTADMECDYTAQGSTGPLTLTLSIDQGCNSTYTAGQALTVTYGASANASLTLLDRHPDGTTTALFTNQPVLAGQSYMFPTTADTDTGVHTLILTTTSGMVQLQTSCQYTSQ